VSIVRCREGSFKSCKSRESHASSRDRLANWPAQTRSPAPNTSIAAVCGAPIAPRTAGAIYDRAVFVYAMGRMGALNDDMGASVVASLTQQYRGFRPARILDMGCSVGHSTLPYVDAYPEAEVYAIDVAAPMLRYAHARATSLGRRVHFSQQNAESTNFPDEPFDLIVSHILLHETSAQAIRNIMRECHRLLRKGAMTIHAEVPRYAGMDPYDSFMLDWDTCNNNATVVQTMVPSAFEQAKARTRLLQGG